MVKTRTVFNNTTSMFLGYTSPLPYRTITAKLHHYVCVEAIMHTHGKHLLNGA
jgi:hypothetical protein